MKKFPLILMATLAIIFFACDNTDDVEEIKPDNNVELNNTVSIIVETEEASEAAEEIADYEVDIFSFLESEYLQETSSKQGDGSGYNYGMYATEWQRYKGEHMPEITIEFGEDGRFPMTITINYGEETVLYNGTVISGVVKIEMTARPHTDGSVREVTYDLMIDSVDMNGNKRIEFTGEPRVTKKWESTSEITFTYPDGTELYRSAERTREWISGLDTKWDLSDDKVQITGSVTCVDTEQNEYSKVIDPENPLIRLGTCRFVVEGVVTFSQNGEDFAQFDYGDGECDNTAIYTYTNEEGEEVTEEVIIGKCKRKKKQNND